ncbi:MAG: hypothetical protein AB1796_08470 [Bacillota bacterium]
MILTVAVLLSLIVFVPVPATATVPVSSTNYRRFSPDNHSLYDG